MTIELTSRIDLLLNERKNHAAALQAIDDKLEQIGRLLGAPMRTYGGKRRGRPPKSAIASNGGTIDDSVNDKPVTLADHLAAVIRSTGKPQTIPQLLAGIANSDYKSKSKDLRPMVGLSLIKDKRFKRVERGIYDLK